MAKLKLVHSATTAIGPEAAAFRAQQTKKKLKGKGAAAAAEIYGVWAGCKYHKATTSYDNDNDLCAHGHAEPFYELVKSEQIDRLLDDPDSVVNDSESLLLETLQFKHPAPRAETTLLTRVNNWSYRVPTGKKGYNNKPEWTYVTAEGWVVLPKPLYDVEVADLNTLKLICLDIGPVLLRSRLFESTFGGKIDSYPYDAKAKAEAMSFVAVKRECAGRTFVQVNYNPRAIGRREYVAARNKTKKRMGGVFPTPLLFSFYAHLHPSNWPDSTDVPFKSHVTGRELFDSNGWGRRSRHDYTINDVMGLIQIANRLFPGKRYWHSNKEHGCDHQEFRAALVAGLDFVHGVEKDMRDKRRALTMEHTAKYKRHNDAVYKYQQDKDVYLAEMRMEDDGCPTPLPTDVEMEVFDAAYEEATSCERYHEHRHEFPEEERRWGYLQPLVDNWLGGEYTHDGHSEPELITTAIKDYVAARAQEEIVNSSHYNNYQLARWLRKEAKAEGVAMPAPPREPTPPSKARRRKRKKVKRGKRKAKSADSILHAVFES